MELAPARALGANILPEGDVESGLKGWSVPRCWSEDSSVYHGGSHSLRFSAGPGCVLTAHLPDFAYQTGTPLTFGAWVKASPGSNLQARIYVFDSSAGALPVASTKPAPVATDWTHLVLPDVDILPLHQGDNLQLRLIVSVPRGQTPSGTVWFDDVTSQPETPWPISTFLLYPNFRGYLWQSGPQTIRLHVEVPNPSGMVAQIVVQQEGGATVNTVQKPAQSVQEIDVDASGLALGSYLLHTNLVNSSGKVVASYPDYRVTKVSDDYKNSLISYIDIDNFLVHNGQKEFVWGVYDRDSSVRCHGCMYRSAEEYEKEIKGFDNKTTFENYRDTHVNTLINFAPWSAISPGPPAAYDQLDPALEALDQYGIGYLQTVNNWAKSSRYRPFWARSLSDDQLWELAGKMMKGKKGALGYYTFDEPPLDQLPQAFDQYKVLRDTNPGSIAYGALINATKIYRWRDASDAIGCDPYPVGVPINMDEFKLGLKLIMPSRASYQPPMLRIPSWTDETERQVYGSRPVWMVLQLFRQWGKFPTYEQMKYAAYTSIVHGANGILWWGFVSAQGIEGEWYQRHNTQPYFDFKKLSDEVTGLDSLLILPAQRQYLKSVSNPNVHTLVKADSSRIVIFASNDSDSAAKNVQFSVSSTPQVSNVAEVYSETRTLPLDAKGAFADSFAPYEAHVYILKRK